VSARLLPWAAAGLTALLLVLARDVVFPVRGILAHLSAFGWFAVLLAGAWGQGRLLLRPLVGGSEDREGGLDLVLALGLGLGALSLEAFGLAALGLFRPGPLSLLLGGAALSGVGGFLAAGRDRGRLPLALPAAEARLPLALPAAEARLPLAAAGLAALVLLPFVLVPNRAFDALAYHLEVPARFLEAGRLVSIPENLYSNVPLLTEMLYGGALGVCGVDLAGMVGWLFFLLTLALVWAWGRRRAGESGAAWAVALLALTPVGLVEVTACGSDWSAAFYTLAAVFLLSREGGPAFLAGAMAGLAAGCKHPALGLAIVTPALALSLEAIAHRRPLPRARLGAFLATALLVASPWYLKNWAFTGDPLYPLLSNLGGGKGPASSFITPLLGGKPFSLLWEWAIVPFRWVFDPQAHNMSAGVGVLPLALLPLLLLPATGPARPRSNLDPGGPEGAGEGLPGSLAWWMALSFAAWYLTYDVFRYGMPVYLAALLFLGAGLARALAAAGRGARAALLGAAVLALAANLGTWLALAQFVDGSVGAAMGVQSPQRYLRENYPPFAAIEYLNRMSPPPGKVLFVGEMRGFYSRFPRVVPSNDMPNPLLDAAREGLSSRRIRDELVGSGITHLLVNPAEWERMAKSSSPRWDLPGEGRERVRAFIEGETRELFSSGGVAVLEVLR